MVAQEFSGLELQKEIKHMKKEIDLAEQQQAYQTFLQTQKTVMISSITAEGLPLISYAPYILNEGKLYIYISRISDHYASIQQSECIQAMLIADEVHSPNLFARERLRFVCRPRLVEEHTHEVVFQQFEEKFKKPMIDLLRGLDFSLFELTPLEGRYVVGFGKAFDVNLLENTISHVVIDKK